MPIIYRKYRSDDLVQLQKLIKELGYPISQEELEKNIALIIKRGGDIIVADEAGELVGSVCTIIDARLAEGVCAEIVSLIVNSSHRGKGVGKSLVKRAEEWARLHTNKVRVRSNEVRNEAHSFYKSIGYENIKNQKVYKKLV